MRLRYTDRAKDDLDMLFSGMQASDMVWALTILQMPKLYAKQHNNFRRALIRRTV